MRIDAHCHAWHTWPYSPSVPDPDQRGTIEQLLHEMDLNEIDQALVVCAEIDHNPANNDYIAAQVARNPARLHMVADVDSMWKSSYHQPGATDRLKAAVERWPLCGFTHYLKFEDDASWLYGEEGLDFFQLASEHNLIASLHCHPHQIPAIRIVARHFPHMPVLIHHLGHPKVREPSGVALILEGAQADNIYIKISGFYYATAQPQWDYPLADVQDIVRAIYQQYGAQRMCWGSDYPVVRSFMTYRQAVEKVRTHCRFITPDDLEWVMGKSLAALLEDRPQA